jgi:hypothetical protein
MIVLEFVGRDPVVCIDGEDVTNRVASVDLLPLGMARVHLWDEPKVIVEKVGEQWQGRPNRQIVQGHYVVKP